MFRNFHKITGAQTKEDLVFFVNIFGFMYIDVLGADNVHHQPLLEKIYARHTLKYMHKIEKI